MSDTDQLVAAGPLAFLHRDGEEALGRRGLLVPVVGKGVGEPAEVVVLDVPEAVEDRLAGGLLGNVLGGELEELGRCPPGSGGRAGGKAGSELPQRVLELSGLGGAGHGAADGM